MDVLARYPKIGYKEKSELHLLGFMRDGTLTTLGVEARRCRTKDAVAKLWCSWVKRTSNVALSALNRHLISFKRAANRFWHLKAEVRLYFFREMTNADERETLQAIELCCNGFAVVDSLSVRDFKTMAPVLLSGKGLSEFIKQAVADYLDNKGGRSWTGDDRRTVLNAWRDDAMILRDPMTLRWKERTLWAHGGASLLEMPLSALLCSKTCPGSKILEAIDLGKLWRTENRGVISGFHTPVEQECLRIFLQGPQHIVVCPARGLDPFYMPPEWQIKFDRRELLITSPFDLSIRRPTKETAEARTRFVLDLATDCTVIYATPGGVLERLTAQTHV